MKQLLIELRKSKGPRRWNVSYKDFVLKVEGQTTTYKMNRQSISTVQQKTDNITTSLDNDSYVIVYIYKKDDSERRYTNSMEMLSSLKISTVEMKRILVMAPTEIDLTNYGNSILLMTSDRMFTAKNKMITRVLIRRDQVITLVDAMIVSKLRGCLTIMNTRQTAEPQEEVQIEEVLNKHSKKIKVLDRILLIANLIIIMCLVLADISIKVKVLIATASLLISAVTQLFFPTLMQNETIMRILEKINGHNQ
jgi:hypothetical protein